MTMRTRAVLFLTVTMFLSAVSASGQISLANGAVVNGLPLRTTYGQVTAKLGKPTREIPGSCVDLKTKRLEYDGLKVEMWVPEGETEFRVSGFEISSGNWTASGIGIGALEAGVKKRFGKRFEESVDAKGKTVFYLMKSEDPIGNTAFWIIDCKVARIGTRYLILCSTS